MMKSATKFTAAAATTTPIIIYFFTTTAILNLMPIANAAELTSTNTNTITSTTNKKENLNNIVDIPYLNGLISAFGDFDSDKLTDIFVISNEARSFEIIKQYDLTSKQILIPHWKCNSNEKIFSIIPSDFNGDAMLDLILLTKNFSSSSAKKLNLFNVKLLFGNREKLDCSQIDFNVGTKIIAQPLLLDINGDMISDLIVVNEENVLQVWIGQESGVFRIENFPLGGNHSLSAEVKNEIAAKWSRGGNAFIDLNNDNVADIFFNNLNASMQYWLATKNGYVSDDILPMPKYEYIGSSSFADINADGIIDHLLPVCAAGLKQCSIIAKVHKKDKWDVLTGDILINNERYVFDEIDYDGNEFPVTLRIGDINGDGFVDLITIMRKQEHPAKQFYIVLFLNEHSEKNSYMRTFRPYLINETLAFRPKIVSFFDLHEDGKLDIILSRTSTNRSKADKDLQITIIKNTQMIEANFLKVLVTSGRCLDKSCYEETILERGYRVPYGTNKAGPAVSYELIDATGHMLRSVAGQLSQSSHFALQLPYCLFGLGPDSNYIDHVYVTFPTGNVSKIFSKDVIQIVPDSQIVVIPHPIDDPASWVVQLFVTPSEIIYKTLYTFLGICAALVIMIGILHRREQIKDAAEAEQYRITWPERRR